MLDDIEIDPGYTAAVLGSEVNRLRTSLSLAQSELTQIGIRSTARISELDHQLKEADLEVQRHHVDFERVRAVLDHWEGVEYQYEGWDRLVTEIRNIVG